MGICEIQKNKTITKRTQYYHIYIQLQLFYVFFTAVLPIKIILRHALKWILRLKTHVATKTQSSTCGISVFFIMHSSVGCIQRLQHLLRQTTIKAPLRPSITAAKQLV